MQRLRDYLRFAVWQAGFGYAALWAITFWALDFGPSFFSKGGCRADEAKVLFYWVCEPTNPLSIAAHVANTALTVTVWAPVYVAAATVLPEAAMIAIPILITHLIGLPAAILVAIRLMQRLLPSHRRAAQAASQIVPAEQGRSVLVEGRLTRRLPTVPPRAEFGLRARPPR